MRGGSIQFSIEGLSLERLLNQCVDAGIVLIDVRRPKVRVITATVASGQFRYIRNLAKQYDWKLTVSRVTGLPRLRAFAWRRAALLSGVILFVAFAWYMCNCIWSIEIHGAGPYTGEIRQALLERDIKPGRFNINIDVEDLRSALSRRLSGLAWVSVSVDGVRLKVYCVQGVARDESALDDSPRDIYAARDGVIESIRVAAGTAVVKQGDAVRKGQLLVKGEERSWGGTTNAVAARAEALARVWFTAEVIVPATETITIPVGDILTRTVYVTPWYEWSAQSKPTVEGILSAVNEDGAARDGNIYLSRAAQGVDAQARNVPIGAILPIWLRIEEYQPVAFETHPRDLETVKYESALAALRQARELAGLDKPIIDKWVEYSIIDHGNVSELSSGLSSELNTRLNSKPESGLEDGAEFAAGTGIKAHLTLEVIEDIADTARSAR